MPLFAEARRCRSSLLQRPRAWRDVLGVAGDYVGRQISARAAEVDRLGTPHHGRHQGLAADGGEPARAGRAGFDRPGAAARVRRRRHAVRRPVGRASRCSARADAATMVQYAFYSSPATMILRFGSDAQKQRWVPRLASGEIIGWVAMTEPEAGSDVGNISTTAHAAGRRDLAHQRPQAVHLERQRRGRRAAGAGGAWLQGTGRSGAVHRAALRA